MKERLKAVVTLHQLTFTLLPLCCLSNCHSTDVLDIPPACVCVRACVCVKGHSLYGDKLLQNFKKLERTQSVREHLSQMTFILGQVF